MATVLFVINLVCAAALVVILWHGEKLRSMVAFHVAGLVVAASLYATMAYASAAAEVAPGRIPVWFYLHLVTAGAAYVPFLVFLVVSYVRLLGSVAAESVETSAMKLEDASSALRFGHGNRAAKLALEVLETDPDSVEARTILAQVHLNRGRYDKAVGSYRLAMPAAHDDAEFAQLVFTVAVILNEHLGDGKGACRELDLIRKRMPGTPQAEKAQRWIVRIMDEDARTG